MSRDILSSAVGLAADLTRARDADTGVHLDRVSRYTRLIAGSLALEGGLPEEFVEDLPVLASAHDIGKLAIPDHVLLKQGPLDPAERDVMEGHVRSGIAVVEGLIRAFDLGASPRIAMLRNVVRSHHESLDGTGYPDRLKGDAIPLEARIVAVADVFDALTTERPYKRTWSPEAALAFLVERQGTRFDARCVSALERQGPEVESIRLDRR